MLKLKGFVGMVSAVILSTPLNVATLVFSENVSLGAVTVIAGYSVIALCGIFYDMVLSKIRNSISSYERFLAFTGLFWTTVFPFQQYLIELIICNVFDQPPAQFNLQYMVFGMVFGLGFGLIFSIIYIRLLAYTMLRDSRGDKNVKRSRQLIA